MKRLKKALWIFLLLPLLTMPVRAEEETAEACIQNVLQYYRYYRQAAAPEIDDQLARLEALDPRQGELWRRIMAAWEWTDTQMPVYDGVLPDGLAQDDSLCIVVLGFGLDANGAMKPELLDRLKAAKASAEKYPNAFVLCTGGETSRVSGVSEAGTMAQWLKENGIGADRILLEPESLSTTDNARKSSALLRDRYPQVKYLALITSDYHLRWAASLFAVTAVYEGWRNGVQSPEVVGSAFCETDNADYDSYYSQAWGIAIITGTEWTNQGAPELYLPRETVPAEAAVPVTEAVVETAAVEEEKGRNLWFLLIPATVVLAGLAWIGRKKQ